MNTITKSLLAALLLMSSATLLVAQTTTPAPSATTPCPLGYQPGYGRSLTPDQRVQHRAAVQKWVADLRQKQTNGTITAQEQAWLRQAEQRGGMCINGVPRGFGAGRGPGAGNCFGAGQGRGRGLRNGTGPRSLDGTCPNIAPAR